MADNVYNLKFTLSNGDVIDAGQITAPQGPKGDKGDSGDIKSYPVGSIYLSASSATPGSLFGGTWEQIKDVFLLSAGNTYHAGLTGGSADAVVVEHAHTFATLVASEVGGNYTFPATANNYSEIRQSAETNTTGVSGVGKNMPPYLVVYMWKRIA